MAKEIEIISAVHAQVLKTQLQEMVNEGWEIKGVVGYNPHNTYSEPFVILERTVIETTEKDEEEKITYDIDDPFPPVNDYTRPEPHHQEICISMG